MFPCLIMWNMADVPCCPRQNLLDYFFHTSTLILKFNPPMENGYDAERERQRDEERIIDIDINSSVEILASTIMWTSSNDVSSTIRLSFICLSLSLCSIIQSSISILSIYYVSIYMSINLLSINCLFMYLIGIISPKEFFTKKAYYPTEVVVLKFQWYSN